MVAQLTNVAAAPTAPRKLLGLGHMGRLIRKTLTLMEPLRYVADLVWIYPGTQPVLTVKTRALVHRLMVTDGPRYDQDEYFDKITATRVSYHRFTPEADARAKHANPGAAAGAYVVGGNPDDRVAAAVITSQLGQPQQGG